MNLQDFYQLVCWAGLANHLPLLALVAAADY